jgi:hypothetical protein
MPKRREQIEILLTKATRQVLTYAAGGGNLYLGGPSFPTKEDEQMPKREGALDFYAPVCIILGSPTRDFGFGVVGDYFVS